MTSGPQITNILLVIVRLGRPCKGIALYASLLDLPPTWPPPQHTAPVLLPTILARPYTSSYLATCSSNPQQLATKAASW